MAAIAWVMKRSRERREREAERKRKEELGILPLPKKPAIPYYTDERVAAFVPAHTPFPMSKMELAISCRNILSHHILTKGNPYCVASMKRPWQEKYREIAQTEMIQNTLNPEWMTKIVVDYNFKTVQNIKSEILDKDLKEGEFLGRFETTLKELVSSYGKQFVGKTVGKVDGIGYYEGEIIIQIEEMMNDRQIVKLQFCAENLPKSSSFRIRNAHIFLVIFRANEDGSYSVVAKSKPVASTENPTWETIHTRLTTLCNSDADRSIKIDCFYHRSNGNDKLIGTTYTSLNSMKSSSQEPMLLVNEEKRANNPDYVATGELKLLKITIKDDLYNSMSSFGSVM